jgi:LacI family transcriptional regulator
LCISIKLPILQTRMNKKLTIKDIAKLAGVSHSTVSRALNDSPVVNEETRKKIKDLAQQVNFEFNAGARMLKNRHTGIVGLVYLASFDNFGSSLYINQLFTDLRHHLEIYELDALLIEAYHPETGQSNIRRLIRQNKVDAFIIVHPQIRKEDYQLILDSGHPMVHVHTLSDQTPKEFVDYYLTDNYAGGYKAGKFLVEKPVQEIITITVQKSFTDEFIYRTKGFRDALEESGLALPDENILNCKCDYRSAYSLVKAQKDVFRKTEAVFVQADIIAFGVLNALKEEGFKIPSDIQIIGFDDTPVCLLTDPQLTTVQQPRRAITEKACKRVNDLLKNEKEKSPIQERIEPELIIRGSA